MPSAKAPIELRRQAVLGIRRPIEGIHSRIHTAMAAVAAVVSVNSTAARPRGSWRREQIRYRHTQAVSQRMNHRQGWVGAAGLNATQIGSEQTAAIGEIFLRHLRGQAQLPDTIPEPDLRTADHIGTVQ